MSKDYVGRELGGYRITEPVSKGNMAEVYKALQASVDRVVAIKIISPLLAEDPEFVARFRQEARIIAALEHPHILPVIDFGEEQGTLYLVTRYLNGGTLHDLIRKGGPLAPEAALRYLADIADAIDYAHSQGVVHRDIKPKNVLLDTQSNPFVADFGLAKLVTTSTLTRTGLGMIGTPHYMSPEQCSGQPAEKRSDIYSLGIMLYEMLTGEVPYNADSVVQVVMMQIHEPVPNLAKRRPELAGMLDPVLTRALAKKPAERYATGRDFAAALARAIGQSVTPVAVPRPRPQPSAGKAPVESPSATKARAAPWRWLLAGAAGAILTAFLGFGVFLGMGPGRGQQPDPTPTAVETLAAATQPAAPTASPAPPPTDTATAPPPTLTEPAEKRLVWDKDAMTIVYIPAGEFLLGSSDDDPEAQEDEKPQQTIYLDAFWIDRTEVTVAQFQEFVNQTGYVTEAEQEGGGVVYSPDAVSVRSASWKLPQGGGAPPATGRQPVVQVSWNDARAYCEWAGRRLPTEAEWDKAARGTEGWIYPWGDQFDGLRLNFCDKRCSAPWRNGDYDDTFARAANVSVFPAGASPYDALDMSGNVWEWVNDFYDFRGYYRFPTANPPGVESGTQRVARGGSWIDTPDRVRAGARLALAPNVRNNVTGFRCAVSASAVP